MIQNLEMGLFDVKTHFSEVVDRVLKEGRSITVTRRGKPVVDIIPSKALNSTRMSRAEALIALDALRQEVSPIDFDDIKAMSDEGRNR